VTTSATTVLSLTLTLTLTLTLSLTLTLANANTNAQGRRLLALCGIDQVTDCVATTDQYFNHPTWSPQLGEAVKLAPAQRDALVAAMKALF
jgi:hypothetical protein